MKKRNMLVLTLITVLILSLTTGCGSKSPKEVLNEAMINTSKINTSEQEMEIAMSLSLENTDPMTAMIVQMINNASMKARIKSDQQAMTSSGDITIDLNGMAYSGKMFITSEKVAFKLPTIQPYVMVETPEKNNEVNEDTVKAMEEMTKSILNMVENDQIEDLGKEDITMPEGNIETTVYKVELSDKEIKEIIGEVVPMMYDNPVFRQQMTNNIKSQLEMQGIEATEEEIKEQLDQQKKEFEKNFSEMNDEIKFSSFNMTFHIDNKSNIRKTEFNISMEAKDETTGQNIEIGLNSSTKVWNINESLDIEIPEINEENSIKLEDLLNQFMGPFLGVQ